ncbi:MAG: RagB/SusD family nutrient uptake outer membrane protein [Tannerellaceae bacterium]|nr:RagB/SusD family nutrient uptake outer membrane protein [Tannerellaceae bacterium]
MKNIISFLMLTAGLLGCLPSCVDSVLDKKPLDIISDDIVWDDPNLVDAYLASQYANTNIFELERSGDGEYWDNVGGILNIGLISDESGNTAWSVTNPFRYKTGGLNISGGLLEWWERPYAIIRNLNVLIEKLPESSGEPDFIASRVSEARFLRAFNYFAMVKRYGGVPLMTKALPLDAPREELYPTRNSEQEIYDFVISEVDAIEEALKGTTEFGRSTQGAALALKCRAALYAGSIARFGTVQLNGLLGIPQAQASTYYQKAYDAAKKIGECGYALYNADEDKAVNFRNIFLKKRNSEIIFVEQHDYNQNVWRWGFFNCPKPHGYDAGMSTVPYLEMAEEFEYADGRPGTLDRNAIQQGLWSMEELWGGKEPRFFATLYTNETPWKGGYVDFHHGLIGGDGVLYEDKQQAWNGTPAWGNQYTGENNFGTGFGVLKLLEESSTENIDERSGTDCIVFRYGEVLLNLAEAAFELDRIGEALEAVNQIRDRAGVARRTSIDRDAIRHERKVELAYEGHRYWDVRRWRIAVSELSKPGSALRYILDYNTRKYKLQVLPDYDGTTTPPRFYEQNYYLPITLTRTGANPNLVENPGY